jgi:hypothetical protein
MATLEREFVTEHIPTGWVICEKWMDGALNIIEGTFANERDALSRLKKLRDNLINTYRRSSFFQQ